MVLADNVLKLGGLNVGALLQVQVLQAAQLLCYPLQEVTAKSKIVLKTL
jgi:hypothetical protein